MKLSKRASKFRNKLICELHLTKKAQKELDLYWNDNNTTYFGMYNSSELRKLFIFNQSLIRVGKEFADSLKELNKVVALTKDSCNNWLKTYNHIKTKPY